MKVLLLPANPTTVNDALLGSVFEHAKFLVNYKKVFWHTYANDIVERNMTKGYFFYTPNGQYEYSFTIDLISKFDELENPDILKIFVPPWRIPHWNNNGGVWILISEIRQLFRSKSPQFFGFKSGPNPFSYGEIDDNNQPDEI